MASTIAFLTDNHIVNSTFTMLSGVENAQFSLTNINKVFTTKEFQSTGTSCVIQIDMGSNKTIDTVAIAGHNIDGLGITAATIEFSPTIVFPGTSIETIDLSADHNFGFKYFTSGSYRYAKLTLTATALCKLSNIYLGSRTEIANNNFDTASFSYSLIENFKAKTNNYGQHFIDKYNSVNNLSGAILYANKAEFEQINNIYAEVGNTTPIWFILDNEGNMSTDGSSAYLFSGYFYLNGELNWQSVAPGLWNTNISMSEIV